VRAALAVSVIIVVMIDPALADPLYCSRWLDITTCSLPGGYVSHETNWQGRTNGWDNRGNRWSTSRWQGIETTTGRPPEGTVKLTGEAAGC
jgi:hypothetical protein